MPAELLSEVFSYVVESGIIIGIENPYLGPRETPGCDAYFVPRTFSFRQVCKHWNEASIRSPRLWVWWVAGATKAWPLFRERSKGAPIFLTWQHSGTSALPGITKDAAVLGRIRRLDFFGETQHFGQLFDAPGTTTLIVSSMRLQILSSAQKNSEYHLIPFFSLSFPKLSELDVGGFLPDLSSPIFATSILTSLKLSFPVDHKSHYTLAQFSQFLRQHPNLQTLDLEDGAMPRVDPPGTPVPPALSRLVDLTLCGTAGCISGFLNLINMSSPLYNVVLRFRATLGQPFMALVDAMRKPLEAYYTSGEQDRPRNAGHLTVGSSRWGQRAPLVFDCESFKSRSAPVSAPMPTLRLELWGVNDPFQLFYLFPLKSVQTFTAEGSFFSSKRFCAVLQEMDCLVHLHLAALDIGQVLPAMDHNPGASKTGAKAQRRIAHTCADKPTQLMMPKLASLTLSRLDLFDGVCDDLFRYLQGRHDRGVGLELLTIRVCRMHSKDDMALFEGVVKEVEWSNLEEFSSDEEESDPDEVMYSDDLHCPYH